MITVIVFVWMVLYAGMLYSLLRMFNSGIEREWFWMFSVVAFFYFLFLII